MSVSSNADRIVSFSAPNGIELRWRNTAAALAECREKDAWLNYGGDKVWPTQQCNWAKIHLRPFQFWPPDSGLDGGKWERQECAPDRLLFQSPVSSRLNLRLKRNIQFIPSVAGATICNSLEQISASPFPVFIWAVTQAKLPEFCLLDIAPIQPYPDKPFIGLEKAEPTVTAYRNF